MLPNRDFSMTALSAESSSFSAVNANPLRNAVPGPRRFFGRGAGGSESKSNVSTTPLY